MVYVPGVQGGIGSVSTGFTNSQSVDFTALFKELRDLQRMKEELAKQADVTPLQPMANFDPGAALAVSQQFPGMTPEQAAYYAKTGRMPKARDEMEWVEEKRTVGKPLATHEIEKRNFTWDHPSAHLQKGPDGQIDQDASTVYVKALGKAMSYRAARAWAARAADASTKAAIRTVKVRRKKGETGFSESPLGTPMPRAGESAAAYAARFKAWEQQIAHAMKGQESEAEFRRQLLKDILKIREAGQQTRMNKEVIDATQYRLRQMIEQGLNARQDVQETNENLRHGQGLTAGLARQQLANEGQLDVAKQYGMNQLLKPAPEDSRMRNMWTMLDREYMQYLQAFNHPPDTTTIKPVTEAVPDERIAWSLKSLMLSHAQNGANPDWVLERAKAMYGEQLPEITRRWQHFFKDDINPATRLPYTFEEWRAAHAVPKALTREEFAMRFGMGELVQQPQPQQPVNPGGNMPIPDTSAIPPLEHEKQLPAEPLVATPTTLPGASSPVPSEPVFQSEYDPFEQFGKSPEDEMFERLMEAFLSQE